MSVDYWDLLRSDVYFQIGSVIGFSLSLASLWWSIRLSIRLFKTLTGGL